MLSLSIAGAKVRIIFKSASILAKTIKKIFSDSLYLPILKITILLLF